MRSRITSRFRQAYRALPGSVRKEAKEAYELFKRDPYDPSLRFKEIELRKNKSIWSVRAGNGYRAIGNRVAEDEVVWGWIGSHAAYDKLIESMRKERGKNPG